MLFTDWKVLIGIVIGWWIYYLPSMRRQQVGLLILGSMAIYAYEAPAAVALLFASAVFNACTSYMVLRANTDAMRFQSAVAGVVLNLLLLAFFKYNHLLFDLISAEFAVGPDIARSFLLLPLPIGISFYTFHGISLLLDTMRSKRKSFGPLLEGRETERGLFIHLKQTLLYLCFFPQLVAGPITKANYFYPQIKTKYRVDIDWHRVQNSLVVGYFLKLVIANNLANLTFNIQYPYFIGMAKNDLILLLIGYSIQIFSDFAGYSLIAIGLAALFGYSLPDNFNFPYLSRSFSEFWTRWHISLSLWLKEYLYFPLGGNRKGKIRTYINLMIVMMLGGLWHGAGFSYAVWGAWHGAALIIERRMIERGSKPSNTVVISFLKWFVVFSIVTLGWLLFKLPDFSHVVAYFKAIGESSWHPGLSNISRAVFFLSMPVILYHLTHLFRIRGYSFESLRQPALGFMVFMIAFNTGPHAAFIYFQF